MKNKIVGLIPVKSNSDRVKKKNTRKFANSSLFLHKLKQLKQTKYFDEIIVSSEDRKILKKAEKEGFNTHIRQKKFSSSSVPMSDVYRNIASEIEGEYIAWINVTNPLFKAEYYDQAIKKFKSINKNKFDCLLSSFLIQDYFFFKKKPLNFKRYPWPRSQDLEGLVSLSFAVNILKRKDMIKWGSCVGKKPFLMNFPQLDSWDIDFEHDFKFCEVISKDRKF